ncbi:hypothetical protein LNKW23_30850 [Paralimibaculum aggregatum]|uniref:Uncharacterized protein n=1 Tax=Paralimibaculum aggregatum TaxID=3036245 RepID=A0ABQ6LRK0_9RHOB|nr:hypothetical protein [Limibaculum sp. NKW23]GMG83871.1 hypothetical protein LNKW23_30850 [Limibaculum sp. NKW23]
MAGNPFDYLWREVDAYRQVGERWVNKAQNAPKATMQEILHKANDELNGKYPVAHEFMKRSIEGKGNINYAPGSPVAQAILKSPEFQKIIKKKGQSFCFGKTSIKFRSDNNLKRSIHDGTIWGDLTVDGKKWSFKGTLTDKYDFRYDLLPKTKTVKGFFLRQAGNVAKACTDLGLMKEYKVTVKLDGSGKF